MFEGKALRKVFESRIKNVTEMLKILGSEKTSQFEIIAEWSVVKLPRTEKI